MRIYTPDKHAFKGEWILDFFPMWEYLSQDNCVAIVDGNGRTYYYYYETKEKCENICEEIKESIKENKDFCLPEQKTIENTKIK